MGRALGFDRQGAAVFSFLMSMPIIAAAAAFKVPAAIAETGITLPLVVGVVVGGFLGRAITRLARRLDRASSLVTASGLIFTTIGLLIGLAVAALGGLAVKDLPVVGLYLLPLLYAVSGYLFAYLAYKRHTDMARVLGFKGLLQQPGTKHFVRPKLLDTSVIIDGRVSDVVGTGFLEGDLIVPSFVLDELQAIADSSEPGKRARGRRGLDTVRDLQETHTRLIIIERDFPSMAEVDAKLIKLAKEMKACILTTDYNLNKLAQIQGVEVLNVNELSNSVKAMVLPGESLGVRVLLGLNSRLVAALPATLQSPRFENLVDRLLDACDRDPARWAVLGEIVGGMTDGALIAVWRRCGTRWIASADHDGGVLAGRLQAVLRTLPEHAAEFAQRYALVDAGRRHLSDPVDQKRLAAWDACREAICDLAPAAEKVGGWSGPLLVRRLEAAARRMAESAAAAMPPSEFPDDARSTRKQECLRTIGAQLLAGRALLPESEWHNQALWKKVCWRFEMGSWPSIPLRKLAFGNDPNRFWIGAGIAAAVLLGVLVIIGLASIGTGKRRSKGIVLERRAGRVADRHHAAGPSLPPEPAAPRDWPGPATPQSAAASGLEPVGPQPSTAAEAIDSGPTDAPSASGSNSVAGSPRRPEGTEPLHRLAPSAAQSAPPTGDAALEPLTPIDGVFKVEQSAALELPPPAIASVRLVVKSAGGRPLPDRILKHATIGAMIVEQGDFHASRYIELRNLAEKRDAEVFDGTEHLLVSFWFALAAGDLADRVDRIVATSCAQAEILIEPGSHYEVRFELEQPAVDQLEAIVEEQVLRRHVQ